MNDGVNLSVKHFKVVLDSMRNSGGSPVAKCVEAGDTEVSISSVGHFHFISFGAKAVLKRQSTQKIKIRSLSTVNEKSEKASHSSKDLWSYAAKHSSIHLS